MRVTKSEVAILVEQILQKRKDDYAIESEKFLKVVVDYFRANTDQEVLRVYEKHPKYFDNLYFTVRNAGIDSNINVPTNANRSFTPSDTNKEIVDMASKLTEMYSMIAQARESLNAHLLSLRTFERIKEQFPEVTIEPKGKTMELSLITPDMLSWLKKG